MEVIGIVDNKGTKDAIHSTLLVDDRRLKIDVGAVKQMLNRQEVKSVQWCPGSEQLADCMTKREALLWHLLETFQTGKRKDF